MSAKYLNGDFNRLFEASPVAFCLVDASSLAATLNALDLQSAQDFDLYINQHPEGIFKILSELEIIDLNTAAVELVKAESKDFILRNPERLMQLGGDKLFLEMIRSLYRGETSAQGDFTGTTFTGEISTSAFRWTLLNDQENDISKILLSFVETTSKTIIEDELQLAFERLRMIREILMAILAAKSPKAIAQFALSYLDHLVPCLALAVSLFESDQSEIVLLAGMNTEQQPGDRTPVTHSPFWDKLSAGQSVILDNLKQVAGSSMGFHAALERGGQSLMIVPLIAQRKLIGTITLLSGNVKGFSQRHEEIVNEIGDSVAIAIHNWQLFETEQNARREADTLREVAYNINADLDKDELLDLILKQLYRVLPYDSASIVQYRDGKLAITANQGLSDNAQSVLGRFDPLPENVAKLTKDRKPIIISDTREDPSWIVFPGAEKIRCWLGVPLIARESFIGLLMLDKWEPNFYSTQSANLALAFANHAAITIEKASLIRETHQQSMMLERRVRMRTRELAALYDITAVTSEFLDLETLLEKILSRVSVAMNCPTVTIHTLDKTRKKLLLAGHLGVSPAIVEYARELSVEELPFVQLLHQAGEPVIFSNIQNNPQLASLPLRANIIHGAGVPIRSKGKPLGMLGVVRENDLPFTREDVALLSSIADHIGIAIENDSLQKQAELAIVVEERERLGRELHDSITQSLFALTLFAATARELVHHQELAEAEQYLDEITNTANQAHKEMRLLLYELRPSSLAQEGLVGALHQRVEAVEQRIGIQCHISSDLSRQLPPAVEGALFQVANEALNNTLKHAKAKKVSIRIRVEDNKLRMEIQDDGVGFEMKLQEEGPGMGLKNMRQRMTDIDGALACQSVPGEGTTIVASARLDA